MGFLFKIFLVAAGLYYLFKLLTGKKDIQEKPGNTQFKQDPSKPSHKTDNTSKSEGEYVDYEEVD